MNQRGLEHTPRHRDRYSGRRTSDPLFGEGGVRFRTRDADQRGRVSRGTALLDGPNPGTIPDLIALHDRAGAEQRRLLEGYPGTLPTPLRGELDYYDGAQFYMLHISNTLERARRESSLTPDQKLWLVSTNGLNDWWMDESGRTADGRRDYRPAIDAFNGINEVCYSYLHPERPKRPVTVEDPEARLVAGYYDHVLQQMPEEQRPTLARLLISINLYQGVSMYQEQGFREHMGLPDIKPNEENRPMLERMRIEKGGIIFSYFWPYFPEITDGIVIPDEPPTLGATINNFLDGNSIYPVDGVGRRLLEIGGINQMMDDSNDRALDTGRGVISPENYGVVFDQRGDEGWTEIVERIVGELNALRNPEDDGDNKLVVDAGVNAVAGLTLFRANRPK